MTAYIGNKIITTVGYQLVSIVTNNLCNYITSTGETKIPEIKRLMTKFVDLDLEATIRVAESVINEIKNKQLSTSVETSINNLKEIIGKIEIELVDIYTKINYNKSLYFLSSLRSYDCTIPIENIINHEKILQKRLKLLLNMLSINDKILKDKTDIAVNTTNVDEMEESMVIIG